MVRVAQSQKRIRALSRMDLVSHCLWGGIAFGRNRRREFFTAALFSVLPDVGGEGVMFSLALLGLPGMPSLAHGHPDLSQFPSYAQGFYQATHSLVLFSLTFALVWVLRKKPWLPLAGWGLHILIDIPTHSLALFPTPFVWPLSSYRVDGVPWRSASIMIPNFVLLLLVYGVWLWRRRTERPRD